MLIHIIDRFFNWMEFEPAIGIMMVVAALVLFVKAYNKNGTFQPATLWEWVRRLIEAASVALLTRCIARFADATGGRRGTRVVTPAHPAAPRAERNARDPRIPPQAPIFAHVFAEPIPYRHAMLARCPNRAQNPPSCRLVRNAG